MRKLVLSLLQGIVRRRHARLRKLIYCGPLGDRYPATRHEMWMVAQADPLAAPDVVIGSIENPYLHRWHIVPRNDWPFGWMKRAAVKLRLPLAWQGAISKFADATTINVYFHHFLRSDDDRALHDHPWWNVSFLLDGDYDEVVFKDKPKGVVEGWEYNVPETVAIRRRAGTFAFRSAETAHRVKLLPRYVMPNNKGYAGERPVWTLFITGPKQRGWGFWCPKFWRHWEKFVEFPTGSAAQGVSKVGRGCGED